MLEPAVTTHLGTEEPSTAGGGESQFPTSTPPPNPESQWTTSSEVSRSGTLAGTGSGQSGQLSVTAGNEDTSASEQRGKASP